MWAVNELRPQGPAGATVGEVLEHLTARTHFQVEAGGVRGLDRVIGQPTVQRLGVAMTGYVEHLEHDRVQMMGRSESGYLSTLPPDAQHALLTGLMSTGIPALVLTAAHPPPDALRVLCDEHGCALLTTDLESTPATARLNEALGRCLLPRESHHAVLVDVYGVGVLITGKAGIGKSEVGLELVTRGHRLVADDLVLLEQESPAVVVGTCPELTRHHMEIRGLGIINVRDLFGAASVRDRKRVEIVVELVEWDPHGDYERLGLDTRETTVADVAVKLIALPARPGRSMSLLIEIAARNHLLELGGTFSARAFADRLDDHLAKGDDPWRHTGPGGAGSE